MSPDFQFIHLQLVDSTNSYLKKISETQIVDKPIIVIADYQQEGRGQHENKWHSEPGKNLLLSILLQEEIPVEKSFYISKITTLALKSLLEDKIGKHVYIKWTNDIYYENKKLSGILIENTMKGNKIIRSIIGVGVNLNQMKFPDVLPNPVSLTQITGKNYIVEDIAIQFWNLFYEKKMKFKQGFLKILDNDYNQALYQKNKWVTILKNNTKEIVKILSVDTFGYIVVENSRGEMIRYSYGEIKFL